jgi:hypothetical protein
MNSFICHPESRRTAAIDMIDVIIHMNNTAIARVCQIKNLILGREASSRVRKKVRRMT